MSNNRLGEAFLVQLPKWVTEPVSVKWSCDEGVMVGEYLWTSPTHALRVFVGPCRRAWSFNKHYSSFLKSE